MSLRHCVFIRAIRSEIRIIKIQITQTTLTGIDDPAETAITPVEQQKWSNQPKDQLADIRDLYRHQDVAVATYEIDFRQWRTLSSKLEGIILIWSKPPFNIRIPMRDES